MALREWIDYCLSGEYARSTITIYDGNLIDSDVMLTLTNDNIVENSMVFDNYSSSGDLLEIGSVIAEEFDFTIKNSNGAYDEYSFIGKELMVDFYPNHTTYGAVTIGAYVITEVNKKANTIAIKALDRTIHGEKQIDWPLLMQYYAMEKEDMTLTGEILELGNVTAMGRAIGDCTRGGGVTRVLAQCNAMFDDYSMVEGSEMTYRELLQYIGFITGTCKSKDIEGTYMGWYNHTIYEPEEWTVPGYPDFFESNPDNRYSCEIADKDIIVTGISYRDEAGNTYTYGSDGYVISMSGCKLITPDNAQTIVNELGQALVGFTYRPYEISMQRLPFLYPLTSITLKDSRTGNIYHTIVTHQRSKINGATQIAARCKNTVANEYLNINKLTGATQQAINEVSNESKQALKKAMEWTLIKQTTATETIEGLEDAGYTEFLLTCQIDPTSGSGYLHERVMASLIIPAENFFGYTRDHQNGAHQAYYSSTYNSGVSYLGNNRVKMYHPSGNYARLYAR